MLKSINQWLEIQSLTKHIEFEFAPIGLEETRDRRQTVDSPDGLV